MWLPWQRLESPTNKSYASFGYKVETDAFGSVTAMGEDGYNGVAYAFPKTIHIASESSTGSFVLEVELRAAVPLQEDIFGVSVASRRLVVFFLF